MKSSPAVSCPRSRTSSSSRRARVSPWSVRICCSSTTRTLDMGREPGGDQDEAIAITSQEVYDRYMKYLVGCADFFRRGITNIGQFTLVKG